MKIRIILGVLECGLVSLRRRRARSSVTSARSSTRPPKFIRDLTFSEAEEQQLGSEISTKIRDRYGVVQDRAVHKYVTLVGSVLASASSRPNLKWTFVVLDTDGVNAFAAPGGFVHITRGALALIQNEAELADVLAHEIGHVTEKHTLQGDPEIQGHQPWRQGVAQGSPDAGSQPGLRNSSREQLRSRRRDGSRQDRRHAGRTGPATRPRAWPRF